LSSFWKKFVFFVHKGFPPQTNGATVPFVHRNHTVVRH